MKNGDVDEYGGIPIDEEPERDQFGGVAVSEVAPRTDVAESPLLPTPIYADDSGIPTNMDPAQRRSLETASNLAAAMAEGRPKQRAANFFTEVERPIIAPETLLASPERREELSPTTRGVTTALAETAAGLTSPQNLALLALGPTGRIGAKIAGGLFGYEMASAQPELARAAGEASVTGTEEEKAAANTRLAINTILGGLTLASPFHGIKRPAIKEPVMVALENAEARVPDALSKSKAALEQTAKDQPQQLESPIEKVTPAEKPIDTQVAPAAAKDTLPPESITAPPRLVPVVRTDAGRIFAGERHPFAVSHALEQMRAGKISADDLSTMQQGFYDLESKRFLTREEAAKARKVGTMELTSEQIPADELKQNLAEFTEQQKPSTVGVENFEVSVQAPAGEVPGYVQIVDRAAPGENVKSPTVESLKAAGVDVPDFSKLPTGKYTWAEAVEKTKGGDPLAVPKEVQQQETLTPEAPEPTKAVEPVGAEPIRLTFEQFKNAPREGKLLQELRKLPRAPKTSEQVAAQERLDAASAAVDKAGLSWIYDRVEPSKRRMVEASLRRLPKTKQKIVNEYESALNDQVKSSGSTDAGQRRLYDRAVEAGIITDPTRAPAFFERESEVAGLGRSSLPPSVEVVRQQRATETKQRAAEAAAQSGYVPDTRGETVKMRKSAERATESPQIPEPVQERIEAAPESRYTQQSMARVEDAVKTMTDAELGAMPADSNLFVASRLEQADRRFRAGDNDGGYQIFAELEKQGTSFGQNINQFKRLAGTRPEYVATVIDKKLTVAGKDPLTPDQRNTAIEITRKSKEADAALDKATDAWQSKPTAENATKAETALDKANAEALELQKFIAKFEPKNTWSVLKSLLQGNLLTPMSQEANVFGNTTFLPFDAQARTAAAGLDILDSFIRNKPREIEVQPLAGTLEAIKGAGRGLAKVPSILIEGSGNVIKGEARAGLHPIKAWINQFAKNPEMPTTGGKITLIDRLNLALEGTFGLHAEPMLRGLAATDAIYKEGARGRITAEQLKLNKVPEEQWAFAQKFPELFLPREALELIKRDTDAAVFQGKSKPLDTINRLTRNNVLTEKLGVSPNFLDFAVATVAPYKLTPLKILSRVLSYDPIVAFARTVMEAKVGNSREAKLSAGRMVVGMAIQGAAIWLYNKGLIAPSMDRRDEAQKARVLAGQVLPPNHINISGLTRALSGGDPAFKPGDRTANFFYAGGLAGSRLYLTANVGRDLERGPKKEAEDLWLNVARNSTLEQARFALNQSFLSGVEGLLTAIKDGNADNYLRQWANTTASIFLPGTLNVLSRATRKYQVDVKADDFKGKIANIVKTKLGFAGLDDYLPLKRDFWGKPMLETPEGRDAIFYHFFDITKNKQVTSDPVELELYRLWRKTSDTAVIPSLPQRTVTLGGSSYALDPKQYERYAELVGENRRQIVDALVINPNFHKLDDEVKIKLLERVYRDGMERGKALFGREFQGQLQPKAVRAGFR